MSRRHLLKTTRRAFLRILGGTVAAVSGRSAARPADSLPQIHVITRNTRFGAVGRRTGRTGPAFKRYPGAGWIGLPTARSSGGSLGEVVRGYAPARGFADSEITVDELSALLFHTNGATGRYSIGDGFIRLRAAPSAGANYAGEVYVVAQRVSGVPPGLYYYGVGRHRLIQLRRGSLIESVGSALEQPPENAAVAVLLTNVMGRYTSQYANRGYRYALIDSGHIGENLRLAASAMGMADVSPLRFWDDRLNELLNVDGRTEAICAVHLVGREGADAARRADGVSGLSEVQLSPSGFGSGSAIERFHQRTKLVPSKAPASIVAGAASFGGVAGGVDLPDAQPLKLSVHDAIRARRSAEGFDRSPITLEQLASILHAAGGNAGLQRAAGVEIFVIAHRVARLEPGAYRYASEVHRLVPVRSGPLEAEMLAACLRQEMAESAAAGFAMATSLYGSDGGDAGPSELGDRRYRDWLIESGAISQRIYLAAGAVGLGARNLAAFVDDRFNEMLRLDRLHRVALHLTMLGHIRRA